MSVSFLSKVCGFLIWLILVTCIANYYGKEQVKATTPPDWVVEMRRAAAAKEADKRELARIVEFVEEPRQYNKIIPPCGHCGPCVVDLVCPTFRHHTCSGPVLAPGGPARPLDHAESRMSPVR